MKLTILGGGGFRVPFVHQALLHGAGVAKVDEVVLHDTDADRLTAITHVIDQLAADTAGRPVLRRTTSIDDAVDGSDFVFAAIRVGGVDARVSDERVALSLGVLGQETVGPGGIAYGLRTIPVLVQIAERIAKRAPSAYVMNFTNPAGMITEAMQGVLGDRVLGICDTPSDLGRRVARAVGADPERLQLDYIGLNHLGWMRRVLADGRDVLPDLLADDERLATLEEAKVFGAAWLRALKSLPNEYLYYYYRNREAVESILRSARTRGEFLADQQTDLFRQILADPDRAAELWGEAVSQRGASYMAEAKGGSQPAGGAPAPDVAEPPSARGGARPVGAHDLAAHGYAGVALQVMGAIAQNRRATMILNVRNGTTVAGLPEDAVIEVPSMVDANGVHPLATAPPDLHQLGLMQQLKAVERATIRAALTGSRSDAELAFAMHPLVRSLDVSAQLVEGYVASVPAIAEVLRR
ncbi:6-phospho-beta-glucosidase [Lysobacter korlensis]|uniref:6-phospho-beta-glucosidase n=1 Tax=Lysobacter korlensis TaxID=553636 RepID=A0ABV6RTH0_9GAMM